MSIFSNLEKYSHHKREIVLLFTEDFRDYQLIRETILKFNYYQDDIIFILNTKLLTDKQEEFLDAFLKEELGTKYKHSFFEPTKHYIKNGQSYVVRVHDKLECYVFTSDPTESDIVGLCNATKKLEGHTTIIRRPTDEEIIERYKRNKKDAFKESISNIGSLLCVIMFFVGIFFINKHEKVLSIIAYVILTGFLLFVVLSIFSIAWSFFSNTNHKWKSVMKSIGVTIIIIAILFLIGYLLPDDFSIFVNDAHRPDKF